MILFMKNFLRIRFIKTWKKISQLEESPSKRESFVWLLLADHLPRFVFLIDFVIAVVISIMWLSVRIPSSSSIRFISPSIQFLNSQQPINVIKAAVIIDVTVEIAIVNITACTSIFLPSIYLVINSSTVTSKTSATAFKLSTVGIAVFHLEIIPFDNPAFSSNFEMLKFIFLDLLTIFVYIKLPPPFYSLN